ncbi:serine/threonine protein kinase [Archangium gephyra]|uniref:Serine/threonine protein kinase n=1 Tax=Archangium gephyra TaxID=48 RepID=A0AAC8TG09_9BACT|nr:serine/threonine-protein kinase [Archangium gephyra]AKJ04677.1 Serine/threonine protein kinase [Archangium gephyra]REG37262.1 serine/threonine protein kinase [Archangium gephyra]
MGLAYRLPEIGEMVGDYRIIEKLGSGSYGHVYKAEQAGRFYALKILRGRLLNDRAKREIGILNHLAHPDVVRFFGCGFWPDPIIGHSYIVMEFAGGRTLETYALEENPSARKSARIVLDIGLTLGEVLRQGVMHRDLKPDNVIIRDGNARPLLIDFGVSTLMGAPALTSSRLPPGTIEFRAPEAWRFSKENDSGSYDYSPADELWALGVSFYWLLTDILPFGDREDGEEGELAERILHQTPVAPHVLNPRVPRALSDICMRMLERDPAARYGNVIEFCTALDAAMAEAEADASWDLPLFEPDAPHNRTTEEDPALVDVADSKRWLRRWLKKERRRGRKPPKKVPAPVPEAEVLAAIPEEKAPGVAVAPLPEPVPPEPALPPASQAPAPLEPPRAAVAPPHPVSRRRSRFAAAAAGFAVAVLGTLLFVTSRPTGPGSAPLDTSSEAATTRQAGPGHEVAQSAKPLDPPGGEGAEPAMGSISAPVMITMLRMDDSSEKPQQKKTKVLGRAAKIIGTGLVCNALTGCPPPQHVRPTPEPAPCPAGSVEAMADKLGVRLGQTVSAYLTQGPTGDITVHEGSTSVQLGPRRVRENSGRIFLSGTFTIREERVYGRFTEARDLEGDGQPFPVCFEMWDSLKGGKGAIRERNGGPDSARIYSTVDVKAVRSFE